MKLIICNRDIDVTLVEGDLISWHDDSAALGTHEGLFNALFSGKFPDQISYTNPFVILTLPLITYEDIQLIKEDVDTDGQIETRKWKIDFSNLEQRVQGSTYASDDITPTKLRWEQVIKAGLIRRDTLRAYGEITRNDVVINDILVAR